MKRSRECPFYCKLMMSFYNGGQREKAILWNAYLKLVKHINSILKVSWVTTALLTVRLGFHMRT